MNNSKLYDKWENWIRQQIPDDCASRIRNMVWLMLGIYGAKSVHLNVMAGQIPIKAKKRSIVKRMSRFLRNPKVEVRSWYASWAEWLIKSAGSGGSIRLVIDATKVTSSRQWLCVAIAYRKRSIPIAWTWIHHRRGHSSGDQQLDLLKYVSRLIPENLKVSLVGDTEFGKGRILQQLIAFNWDFAIRQMKDTKVLRSDGTKVRFDSFPIVRGQTRIFENLILNAYQTPCNLVILWPPSQAQPIYLVTNQRCVFRTIQLYKRRMWIEEMFGDLKGHGFHLEQSRLRHSDRLDRLVLAVVLIYIWLFSIGQFVRQHGLSHLVDRNDRYDLSLFRTGWDYLQRCLLLDTPLPACFRPNLCSVSGS